MLYCKECGRKTMLSSRLCLKHDNHRREQAHEASNQKPLSVSLGDLHDNQSLLQTVKATIR